MICSKGNVLKLKKVSNKFQCSDLVWRSASVWFNIGKRRTKFVFETQDDKVYYLCFSLASFSVWRDKRHMTIRKCPIKIIIFFFSFSAGAPIGQRSRTHQPSTARGREQGGSWRHVLPLRVRYVINPIVPRPQSLDVSVKIKNCQQYIWYLFTSNQFQMEYNFVYYTRPQKLGNKCFTSSLPLEPW